MKYQSEVPADKQVRMRDWKLFPGSEVHIKVQKTFYKGRVIEVGSANPEYVLWRQNGGKKPDDAGVLILTNRKSLESFLGSHMNAPLKLARSMWAVVEYAAPKMGKSSGDKKRRKLYTYDIERMLARDRLRIVGK